MPVSESDYQRLMGSMFGVEGAMTAVRGTIYGERGTGKSTLAAEIMQAVCPPDKGILYVDTGQGWSVLRNHPNIDRSRFKVLPWTTMEDLTNLAIMLRDGQGLFAHVGAVLFDEASTMIKDDLDVLHGIRVGMQQDGTIPQGQSLVPEWPDYNASSVRWRRVTDAISKLPHMHFILTAHEGGRKAKVGRDLITTGWGPSIPASTNAKIQEAVTFVGRMTADEYKNPSNPKEVMYRREMQVKPANKYEAKTRIQTTKTRIPVEEVVPWITDWLAAGGELTPAENVHIVEIEPTINETVPEELQEQAAEADADDSDVTFEEFAPINE